MWQESVQKVLELYQDSICLAFKDCANATAKAGTEMNSAKDTASGKWARHGQSNNEPVTTLREFEAWLDIKKKKKKIIITKKRTGSDSSVRGGKLANIGKRTIHEIFALVQQLDWADGSISDDTEMSLDEFREALVAISLHIDPSPFRAMDQRVEGGLGVLLF